MGAVLPAKYRVEYELENCLIFLLDTGLEHKESSEILRRAQVPHFKLLLC